MKKMKIKKIKNWVLMGAMALTLCAQPLMAPQLVYADEQTTTSTQNDDEIRTTYRSKLNRYYTEIKMIYKLTDESKAKMDKVYNSAMNYMQGCSIGEVAECYSRTVGYLEEYLSENNAKPSTTKEFLMLSNVAPISEASYGEQTLVVLSLMNLGMTDIEDVVITPKISNDRKEWPFVIEQAYDAKCVEIIPSAESIEDGLAKRMDIGWNFTVREDALTGCYPLSFEATYYAGNSLETKELITYINIEGKNPSEKLIKDETQVASNPRIIVTGFQTNPETVYAGSTFELTISVKNTSQETIVKNVLFDLEASVEGSDASAKYAAFLPTSGSSSVYTEEIAPGQTYEMSIEMEAKSDLAQKPYVLDVNMKYDTTEQINLSDKASVSIPIKQEAKMDTSSADIMPESIAVGEQSNVMFSVYNTGKTTLYNVKVTYEGDSVESGITYLGNIAPGATGNVDSMVTGIAQDAGDGTITAVVTYEDEAGVETRYEKELNLYVYEMTMDEEPMMDEMFMDPVIEEGQSGPSIGIIIAVVVMVAVVAVVVVVIVKKKKAKKKQDDLNLLDDDF